MSDRTDTTRQVDPATFGEDANRLAERLRQAAAANEGPGLNRLPQAAVKVRKARTTHPHAMRARSDAPKPGIDVMGTPPKRTKAQQEADARAHRKRLKLSSLRPLVEGVLVRRRAGK